MDVPLPSSNMVGSYVCIVILHFPAFQDIVPITNMLSRHATLEDTRCVTKLFHSCINLQLAFVF